MYCLGPPGRHLQGLAPPEQKQQQDFSDVLQSRHILLSLRVSKQRKYIYYQVWGEIPIKQGNKAGYPGLGIKGERSCVNCER